MLTAEQVLAAQKSNVEVLFTLGAKALESVEKLAELNLQTTKATLSEAAEAAQAVLSAKDAQEFISLQSSFFQPRSDKAAAYLRSLYDLAANAGSESARVAQSQFDAAQARLAEFVDNARKNAPAGTDGALTLVKSTLDAVNNVYETVNKAAKQAANAADANFQVLTSPVAKAKTKRA
jgi:phasin family protein